jgi:hypothetical protein
MNNPPIGPGPTRWPPRSSFPAAETVRPPRELGDSLGAMTLGREAKGGLALLRKAWVTFELVWATALVAIGLATLSI